MFLEIKNRIGSELHTLLDSLDISYSLSRVSPLLFRSIKEFALRDGKRIRPILFVIGYLGYSEKAAPLLYRSAASLELLHDFMLVHDDIIDKSESRRGKPSMHILLNRNLGGHENIKFNGEDLAIVAGDVMYAMALYAFLSVKEDKRRKEAALKKIIEAALYTGSGEFMELMLGLKSIEEITKDDIYMVYDLKTANYTFATPLTMGATLAGADRNETKKLYAYGIYLGRAFQIHDDILGTFSDAKETGKSNLTDLKEAKKTILIWYAYHHSGIKNKKIIKKLLNAKNAEKSDLLKMRKIITESGALDSAKKDIFLLRNKSESLNKTFKMKEAYRTELNAFSGKLLSL